MMDISDGIGSDLQHIISASKRDAVIYKDCLPQAEGADFTDALSGGEDYELLFTVDRRKADDLAQRFEAKFRKPLYNIGVIVKGEGGSYDLGIEDSNGEKIYCSAGWSGYHHF
jgi:thiamine-monophosphate kinase